MPYFLLKQLLDNLTKTFSCSDCHAHFDEGKRDILMEQNLHIIQLQKNSAKILIVCPNCQNKTVVQAKVVSAKISLNNADADALAQSFSHKKLSPKNSISAEKIDNMLKSGMTIADFIDADNHPENEG